MSRGTPSSRVEDLDFTQLQNFRIAFSYCGSYELVAADVPSVIEGAQRHIAEAHGSFELEEMIEDVLEDVPKLAAGQTSWAAGSPRTPQ
jgi:hypothetical protein